MMVYSNGDLQKPVVNLFNHDRITLTEWNNIHINCHLSATEQKKKKIKIVTPTAV